MITSPFRLPAALILLAILPACAPSGVAPVGTPAGPPIRWEIDPKSGKATVSVANLDEAEIAALRAANPSQDRLAELLTVAVHQVEPSKSPRPRMLGTYRIENSEIRFQPLYPLDPGIRYRADFHPDRLPGGNRSQSHVLSADFVIVSPRTKPTVVESVDPIGDVLPENLLKFYVHFSGPMNRGSAYEHVQILEESGKPIDLPFLELGEELWDRAQTRLTLLFDPGRIKRGLKPREEDGPILEAGHSYTFRVNPTWLDTAGKPLKAEFRRRFRVGPPDDIQPDPKNWTIERPRSGTREPLIVGFPESLDRSMLEHAIQVFDLDKKPPISGRVTIDPASTRWSFTPDWPWRTPGGSIKVDSALEDLAGNSIRRAFEVDATNPGSKGPESQTIVIPFRPY